MAIGRALIDVQGGKLTLRVNEEEVNFDIFQAMKFHENTDTCLRVESIAAIAKEVYKE